jgi:hypothetical protein
MWLPRALGGPELDPMELARSDSSLGWCTVIAAGYARLAGALADHVASEIFGVTAASLARCSAIVSRTRTAMRAGMRAAMTSTFVSCIAVVALGIARRDRGADRACRRENAHRIALASARQGYGSSRRCPCRGARALRPGLSVRRIEQAPGERAGRRVSLAQKSRSGPSRRLPGDKTRSRLPTLCMAWPAARPFSREPARGDQVAARLTGRITAASKSATSETTRHVKIDRRKPMPNHDLVAVWGDVDAPTDTMVPDSCINHVPTMNGGVGR